VEGVHLVVKTRRRRGALQNLRRLRGRTPVDISRVVLVLVVEARRAATHLLALGGAPLAGVILLAIRHVGERYLLGRLRHAEHKLLGAWWFRCLAAALHKSYQEFPVSVDGCHILLLCAPQRLAG
jgi:hypothetical protein